jgi:uronate dehydrogenase
MKLKILITGGCGKIGTYFVKYASQKYDVRVVDRIAWDEKKQGALLGESLVMNLQDSVGCQKVCENIDIVVHLAADADPEADFHSSLLNNNILATHNMFLAAKKAGVKRFIFASSAHVVSAYESDIQIKHGMTVRPKNIYGVTKCFGEALAAYYAYSEGMPSIALRIGAYIFPDERQGLDAEELDAFLDPDDFNELLVKCIETPGIDFAIAHAISNNRYKRLDLTETKERFGYQPKADAFEIFKR